MRFASEDIGLTDPSALQFTLAAAQAYERPGSPDGELALAQSVLYLAAAPKSNASYLAFKKAMSLARANRIFGSTETYSERANGFNERLGVWIGLYLRSQYGGGILWPKLLTL